MLLFIKNSLRIIRAIFTSNPFKDTIVELEIKDKKELTK